MKKILVFGVIAFFIGLAFIPSFNAVSNSKIIKDIGKNNSDFKSKNNNLVEIKIDYYNVDEKVSYTVWLTQDKANEFDTIVDKYKNALNSVKTVDETIEINNNMFESMKALDMFPDGLNVDTEQLLINTKNNDENLDYTYIIDDINIEGNVQGDVISNSICSISGESLCSYAIPIASKGYCRAAQIVYAFFLKLASKYPEYSIGLIGIGMAYTGLLMGLSDRFLYYGNHKSYQMGCGISFGIEESENEFIPSNGWVHTIGLNGEKGLEGDMYGYLFWHISFLFNPSGVRLHAGVDGFTGVWTYNSETDKAFFSGYARRVKIGSVPTYY